MIKTVQEIARFIGGELTGDGSVRIKGVNGIGEAGEGDIAFLMHEKFAPLLKTTRASCVIVPPKVAAVPDCAGTKTIIKAENPSIAFSKVINLLFPDRIPHPKGVHPTAIIEKKASLGKNAAIGPYAVVREGASIGDGTIIYPFCYIGKNTKLGENCIIYPGVTIREEITVGDRVIIHPGAIIGGDGFGYDIDKGVAFKIPQIGAVIIEDDVEIGSNVTIDRARFSKTVIGAGTKIDNLVQIAHNVEIGSNCIIVAQVGISGSSRLGKNVILGGQVGVAQHVELADGVQVGAKSVVFKSFPEKGAVLWGTPAKPIRLAKRLNAATSLLPKLYARLNILERKVKELEAKK